jgi:hypothetical protein
MYEIVFTLCFSDCFEYDHTRPDWGMDLDGWRQYSKSFRHLGIQGVADSANIPQGLYESAQWRDLQGNFWLFGGIDLNWGDYQNAMWKYDPVTLKLDMDQRKPKLL